MSFHRLTVPVYTGGLPGGYDYINNALAGTPSPADGALAAGLNAGSYFFGFGEQVTSQGVNRGFKALAQNCDTLDDLLHRDLAVTTRTADVTAVGAVSSVVLTGPDIFLGPGGTPATPEGYNTIFEVLDDLDNEITDGTSTCRVTAIAGGAVGTGFSSGNITLTITPAIPNGKVYRVYYGTRSNLANLPVDALTNIKIRGAEEVSAELLAAGGAALVGTAALGAWADGTTNPATNVQGQLAKVVTDLAGATGSAKIYSAAAAGATYSLVAGTLASQLAALLADANTNAANIATNTSSINTEAIALIPGHRLSLSSGVPVTTSDLGGSTIYYTPYKHQGISLYDGAKWVIRNSPEVSLALTGLNAATLTDVFAYWTGAAVALELVNWTSNTARATALVRQDGILVKSGDPTRRYVGTIRGVNSVSTVDYSYQRFVYNQYNQVPRKLWKATGTASWAYSAAAWRIANNDSSNKVEFVVGDVAEMTLRSFAGIVCGANANGQVGLVGIGIDSTTANSADVYGGESVQNMTVPCSAFLEAIITTPGYHYAAWIEYSNASPGMTFVGNGFPYVGGLTGTLLM